MISQLSNDRDRLRLLSSIPTLYYTKVSFLRAMLLLSHLHHVRSISSSVDATTYITITHVTYVDPTYLE